MTENEMLEYLNDWTWEIATRPIIPKDILKDIITVAKKYKGDGGILAGHPFEIIISRSNMSNAFSNLYILIEKLSIEKFFNYLKKVEYSSDGLLNTIIVYIKYASFEIDDIIYMIRNLPQKKKWKLSEFSKLLDVMSERYPEDLDKVLNCISTIAIEFIMRKSKFFKEYLSKKDFETKFDLNISIKNINDLKLLLLIDKE